MSLPTNESFPLPPIPASPVVLADLPCRKCSYNLRTLSIESRCPECGTPVSDSLHSDRLRDGDPRWLKTIRDGVFCLWITYLLYLFWIATDGLLHVPLHERRWVFLLGGRLLQLAGIWMATTPDPRRIAKHAGARFKIACRAAAVVNFLTGILWLGISESFPMYSASFFALHYLDDVTGIVLVCLILFFLSNLVSRIPDARLSATVWWTALILTIGACLEEALVVLSWSSNFAFLIRPYLGFATLIGTVAMVSAVSSCNAAIRREIK